MGKLTKRESINHRAAETLLEKEELTLDDKIYIYENWHEGASHDSSRSGAFFTPLDYANDFKFEVHGRKVLDLCAGTGILAFCYYHFKHHDTKPKITCVELNSDYVRIGRKLLPEAEWICADIFEVWQDLPDDFDSVISNPPFGRLMTDRKAPRYRGAEFELKIVDIASHLGQYGAFILPQASTPFRLSGVQYFQRVENRKFDGFNADTGIDLDAGVGIDTTYHQAGWKQVSPITEVACAEFDAVRRSAVPEQLSFFPLAAE